MILSPQALLYLTVVRSIAAAVAADEPALLSSLSSSPVQEAPPAAYFSDRVFPLLAGRCGSPRADVRNVAADAVSALLHAAPDLVLPRLHVRCEGRGLSQALQLTLRMLRTTQRGMRMRSQSAPLHCCKRCSRPLPMHPSPLMLQQRPCHPCFALVMPQMQCVCCDAARAPVPRAAH